MDYGPALKVLDNLVYKQTKVRLLDSDGKVNLFNLATLLGTKVSGDSASDLLCQSVKLNVKNEISKENGSGKDENIDFSMEGDQLIVSMPETLREQVSFAVKYIVSEFDKIDDDINRLSMQFQIDRIGVIRNAENTLKGICSENCLSEVSKSTLIDCRNDLGNSIEQLLGNIGDIIKDINNIPTDHVKRLLKVKVKNVLNREKEGRMSVNEYVKGIKLYADISLKLGQPSVAAGRIEKGIDFLNSFEQNELIRVEGWNEEKDRFWIDTIDQYIEWLLKLKEEAESYYIIPMEEKKHE